MRAKIDRATEHWSDLQTAIGVWLDRKPHAVESGTDAEGWFTLTFREHESPPLRLGTIFGDYVNNLESALDQLVYQLVLANRATPSTGNYFPIVSVAAKWDHARRSKLKGVSDAAADKIKAAQPFHYGTAAQRHPLSVLHTANRINKHNVISPTVVSQFDLEPTFEFNRPTELGDWFRSAHQPAMRPELKDGDVLVKVMAVSPRGDFHITSVQRPIPVGLGVGFDLGIDWGGGELPDLLGFVSGVVNEFQDVFEE